MTIAGKVSTSGAVETKFQLTELNPMATITYKLHVTEFLGIYDMIICRDPLNEIRLKLDFSTETIMWDEASIPMKEPVVTHIEHYDLKGINNVVGHSR